MIAKCSWSMVSNTWTNNMYWDIIILYSYFYTIRDMDCQKRNTCLDALWRFFGGPCAILQTQFFRFANQFVAVRAVIRHAAVVRVTFTF